MRPLKGRAEPLPRPHIAPGVAPAALSASRPIPQNFAITLPKRHRANAPDRIRTCDLRFRRPTLYPTELLARAHGRGSPAWDAAIPGGADSRGIGAGRAWAEARERDRRARPPLKPHPFGEDLELDLVGAAADA